MSDAATAAVAYIDRRLATMKRAPRSWGSPESLELQALLLLELRTFLLRRRTHAADPYEVRDAYARFLAQRFPELPGRFMADALPPEKLAERMPELVASLREEIASTLGAEDPFQTATLAVEVRFRPGLAAPPFAKAARYVGRLLGAIAKVVRGSRGRSTDAVFPVPDVRIVPGEAEIGPGVLFAFDPPEEAAAVEAHVRALEKLVRALDQVSGEAAADLARLRPMFPGEGELALILCAARRLYPRRRGPSVRLGGQKLGRAPLVLDAGRAWQLDEILDLSNADLGVPDTWIPKTSPPLPAAPPRLASEAR